MNAADFGSPMTMDVVAFDNYFTGNATDAIEDLVVAPLGERYYGFVEDDIAPFGTQSLTVLDFGPAGTNPSESGLLVLVGPAAEGAEAIQIPVRP